jgi:hypothetical protein
VVRVDCFIKDDDASWHGMFLHIDHIIAIEHM